MSSGSELPSGTVTFLFTDIEGSTRLLKQLRDGYAAVLAEHQELLRAAFAEHGGQVVDTQGDAFFVVFRRAQDAVSAAVAAQQALVGHEWPEGVEMRVRMGGSHRPGGGARRSLPRPGCPSRVADRRLGPWRSGARVADDAMTRFRSCP